MTAISPEQILAQNKKVRSHNSTVFSHNHEITPVTFLFVKSTVLLDFGEKFSSGSQLWRTALIQSALKSTDPGASNGGSDVGIRPFRADLGDSEVPPRSINFKF